MKILGIETSCDETAAAVVENGRKILSSVVSTSLLLHDKTGGVIPEVAAREQVKCMIPVLNATMQQCNNATMNDIDAIAVTVGPGLIGSLLVGVETAKTLSFLYKKPLIPINHIFAHVYANWLKSGSDLQGSKGLTPSFPAIGLVVSGGHTELFFLKNHRNWKWIGGTLDDASGEAFDKTARLLGLGYPGGPAIAAAAAKFDPDSIGTKFEIRLPRPMMDSKDFNFSFSGLKTAVIREVKRLKEMHELTNAKMQELAYEIQEAITDVLVRKTFDAAKKYNVKSILLGGGVAANKRLKEKLLVHRSSFIVKVPSANLCTDNAAVIASMAYFHHKPLSWEKVQAEPNLSVEV
ncbi:tRNA (adenosine(37)-N6)-threonylcarbamoyltransferase complex transferase subunit TsaD [Candidatus Gottesmanbacteria bacterium]|nr:tRNA (adenosine(37)-N6)-threonylcarbamoyltransferase complex transferase subunit TsaD [Candidatus Gottesmanbacteria bacterium]